MLLPLAFVARWGLPTFEDAERYYRQYELAKSRSAYVTIAKSSPVRDARITALIKLAEYDWKFDRDRRAAMKQLNGVDDPCAHLTRASIALEAGDFSTSIAAAKQSRTADGELTLARAILGENLERRAPDKVRLREAAVLCRKVLSRQPGRPLPSETLVGIAVLLDDPKLLFEGWKSYFFIGDESRTNSVLARPQAILARLAKGGGADRRGLALALADSGFYELSVRVGAPLRPDKRQRDIAAYTRYLGQLRALNERFYPAVARGLRGYERRYHAGFTEASRALWRRFSAKTYEEEAFFKLIDREFGAKGYIGRTVNFYGLVLGQTIHAEKKQIDQYGYAGEFNYVSIDRMASRDFTTWYGTTNVGGWGTETTMYQLRPAYLADPFTRLEWVTHPAAERQCREEIAKLHKDDLARCQVDTYAEPSSLPLALKLSESRRLYESLKGNSLAFIQETLRLSVQATVFAHEGRHSLDQRHFRKEFDAMADDERELRAKYSEVAFSDRPRLALTGSIIGGRLDESSGHGKANRRFRVLLVDWMKANAKEIAGLDEAVPLVMQIDRLTDAQLVEIVKSADPMVKR